MLLLPVTHIVLSPRKKNQVLLQPIGYLYAFQSCSLCLLRFCRWPSHTRLLCPTEGEPTNKTQYCWFTTANQKTPASVRKQEITLFSNLIWHKKDWLGHLRDSPVGWCLLTLKIDFAIRIHKVFNLEHRPGHAYDLPNHIIFLLVMKHYTKQPMCVQSNPALHPTILLVLSATLIL